MHQLFTPRAAFLLALLASFGALVTALVAQFGFDLKPCILCLWQRVPFLVSLAVALAALFIAPRKPALQPALLLALLLLFLVSMGLAFFHVGVEQRWWTLGGGCPVTPLDLNKSSQEVLAELLTTAAVPCDQISWRLLGASITIWITLFSAGFSAYLAVVLGRAQRRAP